MHHYNPIFPAYMLGFGSGYLLFAVAYLMQQKPDWLDKLHIYWRKA